MRSQLPSPLRSLPVKRLLLLHQKHFGAARVVAARKPGRALRVAGERVASLECAGPDDACEILVAALETVLELDMHAEGRVEKVRERLLELVKRVRGADARLTRLMEVDERGQEQQDLMTEAAMRDPLTGLYNRRAFEGMALSAARAAAPQGDSLALLFVDVDHFKRVNDTLGHAVGDAVLVGVAAFLQSAGRRGDIVARWGGEEFVVLMPGCDLRGGLPMAEQIRQGLAALEHPDLPRDWSLTVSIGVASGVPVQGQEQEQLRELLQVADERVYQAKGAGRDRVVPTPDLGLSQVA